jgi:thioredoxin-like negative regulator of GroEL
MIRLFAARTFLVCAVILSALFFVPAVSMAEDQGGIPFVSADSFAHNVLAASKPVIVQFDADWCPFCRKFQPIMESFAEKYGADIDFYRINADKEGDLMIRLGARTLPTTLLFYKGSEVSRKAGFIKAEDLETWVAGEIGKLAAPVQDSPAL